MVTLEPGNLVRQRNGRIWRLDQRVAASYGDRTRWRITLIEVPPGDQRPVGDTSYPTEAWIEANCEDTRQASLEPPKGNGVQHARFVILDGIVATETFTAASAMLDWIARLFEANDMCGRVEWFGWDPPEGNYKPDLIAEVRDGEVIWAEA